MYKINKTTHHKMNTNTNCEKAICFYCDTKIECRDRCGLVPICDECEEDMNDYDDGCICKIDTNGDVIANIKCEAHNCCKLCSKSVKCEFNDMIWWCAVCEKENDKEEEATVDEMNAEYKSQFDAVIAEIARGVCSFENAVRVNKTQISVVTYGEKGIYYHLKAPQNKDGFYRYGSNFKEDYITKYYTHGNIFGETKFRVIDGVIEYDRTYYKGKDKQKYFATLWLRGVYDVRPSCGVEVFGMKATQTADGKYKYEGVSIKDLKEACKKNGIKGYSGKDKTDLVKILMKL